MSKLSPRRLVAALAIGALLPLGGGQATGVPAPTSAAAPQARPAGAPRTITLVTGDRVSYRAGRHGASVLEARPGPGRDGMVFHQLRVGTRQLVLPFDALALVANGSVDRRLFDIGLLADTALDDSQAAELPLLVKAGTTPPLPTGARVIRALPIADAFAVRQQRATATQLWKAWTSKGRLKAGIERIRLDGGARISLDRSVPQIGAPAAWRQGATGKGVKVAVLDTGYDPAHPDLAGRVAASRDFTGEGDVHDRNGHGTHVASTIAGTGAASAGRRKGVAPDADLLIGKVCTRGGRCSDSAILAGMQWAAEQGARVISMSLGGQPTDGTDPLAKAVDELTARTGALFVVAAGNSGAEGEQTVGSPASADSALAIGSVTKADGLSPFSSRGPRYGDLALKPDLMAPGSRIVAARAAGTLDPFAVDTSYAELSGTSMATPHVSGAAAIVAQLHPDWKADRIRTALTGSARGLDRLGVYTQGAGRVDVARAIGQRIVSEPAGLSLGTASYPHGDDVPITKTVAYRNDSDRPVTLRLQLRITGPTGGPAPVAMFRLSRTTVTVPANGTASVTVTADSRTAGPDGAYGGWLTATAEDTRIRTAVGLNKEVPAFDLTVRMLDSDGTPAGSDDDGVAYLDLVDVERNAVHLVEIVAGTATLRVPRGTYAASGIRGLFNPDGADGYRAAYLHSEPSLQVDGDTALLMDGRRARQIRAQAPVVGATLTAVDAGFVRGSLSSGMAAITALGANAPWSKMYVVPARDTADTRFTGWAHGVWARRPADPKPDRDFYRDSPYVYNDVAVWPGRYPADPALATPSSGYARVDTSYPTSISGAVATRYAFPVLPLRGGGVTCACQWVNSVEMTLPFRRAEYYAVGGGIRWASELYTFRYLGDTGPEVEYLAIVRGPDQRYRAGRNDAERWNDPVWGPSLPSPAVGSPGFRLSDPWAFRDGDSVTVNAPMFADAGTGRIGDAFVESEHTTLDRNGVRIGSSDSHTLQTFALPAGEATYRLTKRVTLPAPYRFSTQVTSDWTFRSGRTDDGEARALPLLTVRYAPALDDHGRAPAGRYDVPVRVEPQHGSRSAPIRSLTVEASYDDGLTWHRATVRRTPAGWTAALDQPASGLVSLRATATDALGSRVTQTVVRAYELRP